MGHIYSPTWMHHPLFAMALRDLRSTTQTAVKNVYTNSLFWPGKHNLLLAVISRFVSNTHLLDESPLPPSYSFMAFSYSLLASSALRSHSCHKHKYSLRLMQVNLYLQLFRSATPCIPTKPFLLPLLPTATHLFLLFGHSLPDFTCLLGKICDTDARVIWLDLLTACIKPQHVRRHRPLRRIWIFTLLYLCKKPNATSHPHPTVTPSFPKETIWEGDVGRTK